MAIWSVELDASRGEAGTSGSLLSLSATMIMYIGSCGDEMYSGPQAVEAGVGVLMSVDRFADASV